jgi:hypothetical protein
VQQARNLLMDLQERAALGMRYPRVSPCRALANVLPLDYLTPGCRTVRCRNWPPRGTCRRGQRTGEESMKRQLTGVLRRSILLVATSAAAAVLAVEVAAPPVPTAAGRHDMWQAGISGNCKQPVLLR